MYYYLKTKDLLIEEKYFNNTHLSTFIALLEEFSKCVKIEVDIDDPDEVIFTTETNIETKFSIRATFNQEECTYFCVYLDTVPLKNYNHAYSDTKFEQLISDTRNILKTIQIQDKTIKNYRKNVYDMVTNLDWC